METFAAFGVPGGGIFMSLFIGTLAGWIAEKITQSDHSLFGNILFGCIGSVVGWAIVDFAGLQILPGGFVNNLIVATLGAVLVIFAYRKFKGRSTY